MLDLKLRNFRKPLAAIIGLFGLIQQGHAGEYAVKAFTVPEFKSVFGRVESRDVQKTHNKRDRAGLAALALGRAYFKVRALEPGFEPALPALFGGCELRELHQRQRPGRAFHPCQMRPHQPYCSAEPGLRARKITSSSAMLATTFAARSLARSRST